MDETSSFTRRVLLVFAIATAFMAAWMLADVLLFVFGAAVIAVVLRAGGDKLADYTPLSPRASVLVIVALVIAGIVVFAMSLGGRIAEQVAELQQALPEAATRGLQWLEGSAAGSQLADLLREAFNQGMSASAAWRTASGAVGALTTVFLVLLVTLYLAVYPDTYRRGLLRLVPPRKRDEVCASLATAGDALRKWLMGQGMSMLCVGVLVGGGLWLLDVPMAMTLGLLAGLFEFVPVIGPLVASVPAILVGFAQGPETGLYVALLYAAVEQVEGYIILPLAQRWAVALPPALGLVSIVALGALFGIPGVLFATPLTVVVMVLVSRWLEQRDAAAGGEAAMPECSVDDSPGRKD